MLAQWTGNLVGQMHNYKITFSQLAEKLHVTNRYVSMVLNGHREPAGAEERFCKAVEEIIAARNVDHAEGGKEETNVEGVCV